MRALLRRLACRLAGHDWVWRKGVIRGDDWLWDVQDCKRCGLRDKEVPGNRIPTRGDLMKRNPQVCVSVRLALHGHR